MTKSYREDTVLAHAGRDPAAQHGAVNPPVYHASTIIFPSVAEMERREAGLGRGWTYGRMGTPTSAALESAISALDGGFGTVSVSSGLAAVTTALLSVLKAGDHLLMVDTCYGPTRRFCDQMLARLGVETTYYDPLAGAGIAALLRDTTRAIYMESPGSQTFEVQDVPAITSVARPRGIVTLIDNTWATPLYFRPFDHGVDLTIQAATKYIVGHADAGVGLISAADERLWRQVKTTAVQLGQCVAPDEIYLALRGLRTLKVRLAQHQENALHVARWLQERPEVDRVLYPALPDDPGHALWRRDFTGACALFSIVLKPVPKQAVDALVDGLALFGLGASWGGYESLILPANPAKTRSATTWHGPGPLLRLHVGLEDPADLIDDLAAGFDRLAAAA